MPALDALGRRELDGLAEARLAGMAGAAIDIGMVKDIDAGIARRADQRLHLGIAQLDDAHQAQHDAGNRAGGMR